MTSSKRPRQESLYDDDDDFYVPKKISDAQAESKPVDKKEPATKENKEASPVEPATKHTKDVLAVYGARRGERDDMQDAHLIDTKFELGNLYLERCALFAIFDGHGGAKAANYCEEKLRSVLKEKCKEYTEKADFEKKLKKVFTDTYKSIDESFLKIARTSHPIWKDGTTVTTMLLLDNILYVANLGDSKAVVARKKPDGTLSAVCLTVDHNPTSYDERMRIQKTGAVVKDGRVNGIIEVSRSIGDGHFKASGVSCVPDMKKLSITENDKFAIVACDGLWKKFTNEEAINFAAENLEAIKKEDLDRQLGESRETAEWRNVAERLASEAVRRKCGDNVSVILVSL